MALEKLVLNRKGARKLLREEAGVLADLERRARAMAAAAGPGMEVSVHVGKNRARASVITATAAARRAEATGRKLTRAIDAGRG